MLFSRVQAVKHTEAYTVRTRKGLRHHLLQPLPSLYRFSSVQFSSVQSLSRVQLFAIPWIAARQASLSITDSQSSLRLTSIESVMPSSHLILCHPLFLLPPIPPSIRVFSSELTLHMRWPKFRDTEKRLRDLVKIAQVFRVDLRLDFEPPDTTLLQCAGQKPRATQRAWPAASFPAQ